MFRLSEPCPSITLSRANPSIRPISRRTRSLLFTISSEAKGYLIEQGWDPQYGARPLKRAIQRSIEDELAKRILGGEFTQGDTVQIDRGGGALTFTRAAPN